MFSMGVDFIPSDDTELSSTSVQHFGKNVDGRVRLLSICVTFGDLFKLLEPYLLTCLK